MTLRIVVSFLASVVMVALPTASWAGTGSVRVEVNIDGVSDLVLSGSTAQWYHLSYDPPGVTTINGASWAPSGLSNGCNCYSDVFDGVVPAIPQSATGFAVTVDDGRGDVMIQQLPSSANGYRLIVRFDDGPQGGADEYDVTIDYEYADPVPARSAVHLGLLALLVAGLGVSLLRRH